MRRFKPSILLLLLLPAFNSCKYGNPKTFDTPTQGTEKVSIDESYSLFFSSEVFVFMSQYQDAYIYADYKPEEEVLQDLLNDSVDLAVISRDLTKDELEFFAGKKLHPKSIKIADDGVAFILNPENTDSIFMKSEMDSILSGKICNWQQLNKLSPLKDFAIVIDNKNSANANYISAHFLKSKTFPAHFRAALSNQEVVEYVARNKGAIGVISNSWIADEDDSTTQYILSKVKPAWIQVKAGEGAVLPKQGYIKSGEYPYTREVYMINAEGGNGLATGFTAYVAGEKGQLIILKSGMVPAITPPRTVHITTQ